MPALAVVLAYRLEHVQDERPFGSAAGGVLDAAGQDVALQRAQPALDAVDEQHLRAAQDDAELLVLVAVRWHRRARLEIDQIEHCALAEQRAAAHARGELERAHVLELKTQLDAYAAGKYGRAAGAYHDAYNHMFMTGDLLAGAIAKQFPNKFPAT